MYCAPTSGGKSVVAEIIMLHRIVQTKRPALLVLPFVTLCSEKSRHLNRLLAATGKEVKDFYGGLTRYMTEFFYTTTCNASYNLKKTVFSTSKYVYIRHSLQSCYIDAKHRSDYLHHRTSKHPVRFFSETSFAQFITIHSKFIYD